jgi:uncharacterized iron-regulated membrane protein
VVAGLVILMLSVTGVMLTYERQILAWADRGLVIEPLDSRATLAVSALIESLRQQEPGFVPQSVTISTHPRTQVSMRARSRVPAISVFCFCS